MQLQNKICFIFPPLKCTVILLLHNMVFDTEQSTQYCVYKICCQFDMPQKTSPTLSILYAYPADLNVKTTKKTLVLSMMGACRTGRFCAFWLTSQHGNCSVHVSTQVKRALWAHDRIENLTAWGICSWGLAPTGLLFLSHVSLLLFFLRSIHEAADQPQVPVSFEIFNQPLHVLKSWRSMPCPQLSFAELFWVTILFSEV